MRKSNLRAAIIKKLPEGAFFKGRAQSDSMAPLINIKDTVELKKAEFDSISKGDVIAFAGRKREKVYLHRVIDISVNRDVLITKGDNISSSDKPVGRANYLGKGISVRTGRASFPLTDWRSRLFGWSLKNRFPEIPELGLIEKSTKKILKCIVFLPEYLILR